jgi:hypothetical protein
MLESATDCCVFTRIFASGAVRRRIKREEEREEQENKEKERILHPKERKL